MIVIFLIKLAASVRSRPAVLLVASVADDLHADIACHDVCARGDIVCHRIATDSIGGCGGFSWRLDPARPTGIPLVDGEVISLSDVDAIWWRRSGSQQRITRDMNDPATVDVIDQDCQAAFLGSLIADFHGRWISEPTATRIAENKLVQLRHARSLGFSVPDTLVSQDPDEIIAFFNQHHEDVVVKAVRGTHRVPLLTQRLTKDHLVRRRGLALSPAIYQEHIPGDRHVRVCAFSNDIHAYELVTTELDWRPASYSVCYTELPPELTTLIREMLYRLHLRMGIFDFKIDARSGEIVWLEVNPQGQFFFLEGLSGSDLRAPLCKFLVSETLAGARQRHTISERPKRQSRMVVGRI